MNPFWWPATALLLIAALFLIRPLLAKQGGAASRQRRALERARAAGILDQAEYQEKLRAIEGQDGAARAASRPLLAASLLAALALATFLIYPGSPEPAASRPSPHAASGTIPDLAAAAAQLAARLEREPEDLAGWVLLGRSLRALERFGEARDAFARAHALAPEHPEVAVEYAEAMALAAPDRRMEGQPLALIERVLRAEPDHPRALWLRGVAHRQAGRLEEALADWERLLALLPKDAEVRPELERLIAETRGRSIPPPGDAAATQGSRAVKVLVELDETLRQRVRPEDTVFVFARLPEGGRMPVAIRRLRVSDLPAEVRLDAADAMMPDLSLDRFDRVTVGARVSASGLAQPQSGDLEGAAGPVPTDSKETVRVRIDRVLP